MGKEFAWTREYSWGEMFEITFFLFLFFFVSRFFVSSKIMRGEIIFLVRKCKIPRSIYVKFELEKLEILLAGISSSKWHQ